jgi:sterol 14-demethylase
MTSMSTEPLSRPPELRGGLPLLGHALAFGRTPVELLQRGRDRFGEIFSFRLLGSRVAVFTGPEAHEAYFRAGDGQLNAKAAYRFTVPIFGPGIAYDATPERMDDQIGFFIHALREERLRTYVGYIGEEVEAYLDRWGDEGEVDLLDVANELTTFIASRCLIGREFRQNVSAEFARLYHDLEGGINLLAFFWPHLPLPSFRRRDRARVRMAEIIANIIAERRARGVVEEDFLQTLMIARYSDGETLSDDAITGMLLSLIFAGQHTSAVQAAWAGIELLRHPAYVAAVLDEQQAVMAGRPEMTYDTLQAMVCLERAIQESERLHPPLVMMMRKVLNDFRYKQYEVPAGWLAMISPAVAHRLPELFTDPNQYDPDRFGPGRQEHRRAKHTIITFGGGRHACIGMTFAYLQIKAIWSVLLRRFDLDLLDRHAEPNFRTFVVGPRPPCRMRYRRKHLAAGSYEFAATAASRERETEP